VNWAIAEYQRKGKLPIPKTATKQKYFKKKVNNDKRKADEKKAVSHLQACV